jgi:integrase
MPKRIAPLSEIQVRNAKPQEKQSTLFDGGGLYLLISPTGGKLWRLKYSLFGKEKLLALGTYPEISLADARQRREEARKQVANGIDPGELKKAKKTSFEESDENSFEVVAREWHGKFLLDKSDSYRDKMLANFERDVFPWIGKIDVNILKAPELLTVLRRIEGRGALETAHRTRSACSQVLRYSVATGRAEKNCASDLIGALPAYKKGHRAALTDPKDVAPLLRAIDDYLGTFPVKCALKLAPLFFVRPGELRKAEWSEFDFEAAEWRISGVKMKMNNDHIVPLASQALTILKELQPLTGHSKFLFPSSRSPLRPMSDNAILSALRRMGFEKDEMSGHGFRALARTILDEVLHVRPDFIEHQLAHAVKDPNGRAYNRTAHLVERKKMMQSWADYLDKLKSNARNVVEN